MYSVYIFILYDMYIIYVYRKPLISLFRTCLLTFSGTPKNGFLGMKSRRFWLQVMYPLVI